MTVESSARSRGLLLALIIFTIVLGGCATQRPPGAESASSEPTVAHDPDPLEPMNRGIFAFNEALDRYLLKPASTAWDFVVPKFAQTALDNFYVHLNMPVVLANDILQLKPVAAVEDVARIAHNTVFGLGGFIDFASIVGCLLYTSPSPRDRG